MSDHTCSACGQTYRGSAGHDCPGTHDERIYGLEDDVVRLETELAESRNDHANLLRALDAFALSGNSAQLRSTLATLRKVT